MSNWYCVDAGKDDLLCFYNKLDTGDIVLNNFEPNIHGTGCAMVYASRPQGIFPQECRIITYTLQIFLLTWRPFGKALRRVWPRLISLLGPSEPACVSAAHKPLVSSGAVQGPKVPEREPAALSEGSGLCFNLALCCVAINISL